MQTTALIDKACPTQWVARPIFKATIYTGRASKQCINPGFASGLSSPGPTFRIIAVLRARDRSLSSRLGSTRPSSCPPAHVQSTPDRSRRTKRSATHTKFHPVVRQAQFAVKDEHDRTSVDDLDLELGLARLFQQRSRPAAQISTQPRFSRTEKPRRLARLEDSIAPLDNAESAAGHDTVARRNGVIVMQNSEGLVQG